jgi:BASS family bile acid:Na+ symporter
VLLPLALGMLIRGVRPRTADRLEHPMAAITRAATLALLVMAAFIYSADVFNAIGSYAIVTEIVFLAAVALAAHAFGARLPEAQRTVLTIGTCTRNLGAALAPLAAIDADRRTIVMVVIAVPATLAISALAARGLVRGARGPRQQTRAA